MNKLNRYNYETITTANHIRKAANHNYQQRQALSLPLLCLMIRPAPTAAQEQSEVWPIRFVIASTFNLQFSVTVLKWRYMDVHRILRQ